MEYSGRVNVWLAGGFCFLYAAFIVAGDHWPPWMGRLVFQIFEAWGGAPVVATAMCVLAAVPAAFQYGLWDSTVSNRCKRLELLLLSELNGCDYWHASLAAAWRRGYDYLIFAGLLWVSLAVSGPRVLVRGRRRGVRRAAVVGFLVRGRLSGVLDGPSDERTGLGPDARTSTSAGGPFAIEPRLARCVRPHRRVLPAAQDRNHRELGGRSRGDAGRDDLALRPRPVALRPRPAALVRPEPGTKDRVNWRARR